MSTLRRYLGPLKRRILRQDLPRPSFDANAAGADLNPVYDQLTSAIIRGYVHPWTIAIDVGANIGGIVAELVEHQPRARHLAFEPIPHLADQVRTAYPSVSVHEVALSAESGGEVEFHHVRDLPDYSGLKARTYPDGVGDVER